MKNNKDNVMETPKLKEIDFKGGVAFGFINFWRELKYALIGERAPVMTYAAYKEIQEAKKLAPKKVKKSFKQKWVDEFDFLLLTKTAFLDIVREWRCHANGIPFQRTTQEEYLELLNAKRNSKN